MKIGYFLASEEFGFARTGGAGASGGAGHPGGVALHADGLHVEGDMVCQAAEGRPFTATGEIRLSGAQIDGLISFDGATLTNKRGLALAAHGLRVDGDMFCRAVKDGPRFSATGGIRLVGAHISGQLEFDGASLDGASLIQQGRATLDGYRLRVDEAMFCRAAKGGHPFTATGGIHLPRAQLGELRFDGAVLGGSATSLNLQEAEVALLQLHFDERPDGEVDLRRLEASVIHDRAYGERGSWPKTRLEGSRYEQPAGVATGGPRQPSALGAR